MVMTYCDDHFAVYTNVKSLCGTPETKNNVCQLCFNKIFLKYLCRNFSHLTVTDLWPQYESSYFILPF